MSPARTAKLDQAAPLSGRREQILAAAEACFVRHGFHRTTIQDIAREAAMSQGNIYRYFASKEAIVIGLAAQEGERGTLLVSQMQARRDQRAVLLTIVERYFTATSRSAAVLQLDIWLEGARNPVIARMLAEQEAALRAWFTQLLRELARSPACDVEALYEALAALMKGVLVNRATVADYDATPAMTQFEAVLEAGLAGRPLHAPACEATR